MTIKEVPVFEAKARLSELLAAVEQGEQVTITRRGVAVARLVPNTPLRRSAASQRQRVAQTFAQLREQRGGVVLDMPLREIIADGRD
jgi:prevent-host-death family protein